MNTSRPVWRAALVGVALSVMLVLLLAPPTGWMARAQFAAIGFRLPQSDAQRQATETARCLRTARQYPNDVDVQIAAALENTNVQIAAYKALEDAKAQSAASHGHSYTYTYDTAQFCIAALRTLVPRFGTDPALYATLLRYEVGNSYQEGSRIFSKGVYLSRPEDFMLGSLQPSPETKYKSPDPAALAAFDADCTTGERLDPQNAFFTMMRAVGLFAAYRDKEAIQAVLRAGEKPLWNDYTQTETEGRLRLSDATNGGQYALGRVAIAASTLFPHFAPLRGVARVATVTAMQMEQAGNVEGGLALRRALMDTSDHMRVQSTSFIGSLVAIAIAAISTARPGGVPALKSAEPVGLTEAQRWQWYSRRRIEPFAAYTVRHGHPELADLARAESAAGEAVKLLGLKAEPKALYNRLMPHIVLWLAGETLLAAIFWMLSLSAASHLLAQRASFREGRPLTRATQWGIGIAILLALAVAGFTGIGAPGLQDLIFVGSVLTVGIGAGALFLLRDRITRPGFGRFVRAFLITALVLASVAGIISWQVHGIGDAWQSVRTLEGTSGSDNDSAQSSANSLPLLLIGAAALALPLLMLFVFAIWGRVRRVPVNVAVVRGFLSSAVPIACVLLLVWGGLCLHTLQQERQLNAELDRMTAHEGRYYASLAGAEWPGPAIP